MPTLVAPSTKHDPPRFDLTPGDEVCNYEDGTFVPRLPGMAVGDLVLIDNYLRVSRITAEDERGHRVEFAYEIEQVVWVD